ncbi:MAG: hypothetical protein ACP5C4_09205 [Methanomicrobiales archaeon]
MHTRTILLATICLLLLAFPVSVSATDVSRSMDIQGSGTPVEVTVSLPADLAVAGLVEELPVGWEYLDSSLSAHRVRVADGTVLFALVDGGGDLAYRVLPPETCTGTFHGTLHDFVNGTEIALPDTRVEEGRAVTLADSGQPDTTPDSTPVQTPRSPGFGAMTALLAGSIASACIVGIHGRRRNGR